MSSGAAVAQNGPNNTDSAAHYISVTWPANQWSEVVLKGPAANGIGAGFGVVLRKTAGSTITYYRLVGNSSGYEFMRCVTGVFTRLGSNGSGTTFAAGDTLYGEFQGSTPVAKKGTSSGSGGTAFGSFGTDSTIASGGAGISMSTNGDTNGIDSWVGGDFSAGTQSFSYTMAGGLTFAGSSAESRVKTLTASGGLIFSGSSAEARKQIKTTSGGITFGGTAAQSRGRGVIASGGLQFGGTASELRKAAYTGSGGLTFSGTAAYSNSSGSQTFSYTMVGGLTFSGSATYSNVHVQHFSYTASGGLVFSGTTSELRKIAISPSGGIIFGGTGSEIGIHPGASTASTFRRRFFGPVKRGR